MRAVIMGRAADLRTRWPSAQSGQCLSFEHAKEGAPGTPSTVCRLPDPTRVLSPDWTPCTSRITRMGVPHDGHSSTATAPTITTTLQRNVLDGLRSSEAAKREFLWACDQPWNDRSFAIGPKATRIATIGRHCLGASADDLIDRATHRARRCTPLVPGKVADASAWNGDSVKSPRITAGDAYPWAMASKRAKDRVSLKFGAAGLARSKAGLMCMNPRFFTARGWLGHFYRPPASRSRFLRQAWRLTYEGLPKLRPGVSPQNAARPQAFLEHQDYRDRMNAHAKAFSEVRSATCYADRAWTDITTWISEIERQKLWTGALHEHFTPIGVRRERLDIRARDRHAFNSKPRLARPSKLTRAIAEKGSAAMIGHSSKLTETYRRERVVAIGSRITHLDSRSAVWDCHGTPVNFPLGLRKQDC